MSNRCALALFLFLLLLVSSTAQTDHCDGASDSIMYDHLTASSDPTASVSTGSSLCQPDQKLYRLQAAQLLTVAKLPWNVSRVCVGLGAPREFNQSGLVVRVALLPVVTGPGSQKVPARSEELHGASLPVSFRGSGVYSLDVTSLGWTVYTPEVFLSATVSHCGEELGIFTSELRYPPRLAWYRQSPAQPLWQMLAESDSASSFVLRVSGAQAPVGSVPDNTTWTCDPKRYADGAVCDCQCGAFDPDCFNSQLPNTCAGAASVCGRNGTCVDLTAWLSSTCLKSNYGTGDGCHHCCKGPQDPDCSEPSQPLMCGSLPSSDCTTCTTTWKCSVSKFGDKHLCDCDCGAFDTDCALRSNLPSSCSGNTTCSVNGICTPLSWKCTGASYGDGAACDCLCGAPDPDCKNSELPVKSCASGERCSMSGLECVGGPAKTSNDKDAQLIIIVASSAAFVVLLGVAITVGVTVCCLLKRKRRAPPITVHMPISAVMGSNLQESMMVGSIGSVAANSTADPLPMYSAVDG